MKRFLPLPALLALCVTATFFQAPRSNRCVAQDSIIVVEKELCDDCLRGETPDVSTGSFTTAARVKIIEQGAEPGNGDKLGMVFSVGSGWTDGYRLYYNWNTNRFTFPIGKEGGAYGCTSNIALPPGIMRYVFAVYDGEAKKITLYSDGIEVGEAPIVSDVVVNDNPLSVGFTGFGVGSNRMYVDYVEFWNRALTKEEIEQRNAGRALNELAVVEAVNALGVANPNVANVNDAPEIDEEVESLLPEGAKEQIQERQRVLALFKGKYADAAQEVFDNTQKYLDEAPKINESRQAISNADLERYGKILDELSVLEKNSRVHADQAKKLAWSVKLAYPKETAIFSKIGQLENSAERVRQIEKDALDTRQKVGARFRSATNKRMIYVSPEGNDATGDGTKKAPIASLARAFELAAQNQNQKAATIVELRDGTYQVERTAKLVGAENVLVRPAPNATVVLTGGRVVANFAALEEAAKNAPSVGKKLESVNASARDKIFVANLRAAGVSDLGQLARRGYGLNDKVDCIPSLYLGGESQTLARWPNDGDPWVKFGEKIATENDEKTSTFSYDFDRPDSWKSLDDIWAFGLYQWEWAANLRKVTSIDREKKQITFDYRDGSGKFEYYFVNVLEELDAPGEYYVDRENGLLFFYPPEEITTADKLNKANVEFDEFSSLFVELENCKNVLIQGVSFKLTRESFGKFVNCDRCYVDECNVEQIGGNVLTIKGGTFCGMLNSRMREIGAGGLRISGGDRDALVQCKHLMHNNFVSDFSRIDRVYAPAVHADGCGVAITNNLMCDSPHHAMRTDGNDMYVAKNEVHSCVYEYSDQSGIDIYCDPSYRGIVIEKNLWRHIGSAFALCGQAGIRLDDSISGVVMLDNVFYRTSGGFFGAIQIHGGKDNLCKGNLIVDCKQAFSFSPWSEDRYKKFVTDMFPDHVGNDDYVKTYPFFDEILDHPNRNYVIGNKAVNCERFNQNGDGLEVFVGNVALNAEPKLLDIGIVKEYESYSDAFYVESAALRKWLEQLSGKPLKDVGLKGKWDGANIDVSPKFRAIE